MHRWRITAHHNACRSHTRWAHWTRCITNIQHNRIYTDRLFQSSTSPYSEVNRRVIQRGRNVQVSYRPTRSQPTPPETNNPAKHVHKPGTWWHETYHSITTVDNRENSCLFIGNPPISREAYLTNLYLTVNMCALNVVFRNSLCAIRNTIGGPTSPNSDDICKFVHKTQVDIFSWCHPHQLKIVILFSGCLTFSRHIIYKGGISHVCLRWCIYQNCQYGKLNLSQIPIRQITPGSLRSVVYRIVTVYAKSGMLKDRDYDVTPYIIAHILRQIRKGSAKSARYWEV